MSVPSQQVIINVIIEKLEDQLPVTSKNQSDLLAPGWTFRILSNTAVVLTVADFLFQMKTLPEFKAPATNKPVK